MPWTRIMVMMVARIMRLQVNIYIYLNGREGKRGKVMKASCQGLFHARSLLFTYIGKAAGEAGLWGEDQRLPAEVAGRINELILAQVIRSELIRGAH